MRRTPEPEVPALTLPAITERLNGGGEDPARVSEAIKHLLDARSRWTVHKADLDAHLQRLVAEGAEEKKRRPVRDAIARAGEEIKLLEDGEAPLKQRLVKAKAELQRARQRHDQGVLSTDFKEIIEALMPVIDRAAKLVGQVVRGELKVSPSVGEMVIPHMQFLAGWAASHRSDFDAALATLERSNVSLSQPLPQPATPKVVPKGKVHIQDMIFPQPGLRTMQLPGGVSRRIGEPEKASSPPASPQSMQHAVRGADRPDLGTPRRPRKPDDCSSLKPSEVRVRIIRAGYETPDGQQCDAGQVVKLPADIAQKAIGNSAAVAVEMNINRTDVQGAAFQSIDSRTGLTTLGSGGDSIVRVNVGPATPGDTK
jgi:hypothetical protein